MGKLNSRSGTEPKNAARNRKTVVGSYEILWETVKDMDLVE